jgi:hypothetical protein
MRLVWRTMPIVVVLMMAGAAANAQPLGGPGGGRGSDTGAASGRGSSGGGGPLPPAIKPFAANQIDIVGVVREIGPNDRITIEYEETPALTLPAGSRQFVIAKMSLLKDITVGEHVRFRLDSQEVNVLAPFDGDRSQLFEGDQDGPGERGGGRGGRGRGPDGGL